MENLKIVISGYKGFIGRNLSRFLKNKKIKIYKYKKNLNINKSKKFDYFIHLEFYISKNKNAYLNKNLKKIDEILSFCNKYNVPLIFPSTSITKAIENKKIKTLNKYQQAKILCEKKIEKFFLNKKINYKILRLSNVYGRDTNSYGVIPDLIKKMKKKKIILKNYNDFRDFIFIDDLNIIIYKLLKLKKTLKLNISYGKAIKIKDLSFKIKKIFKYKCNIVLSKKYKHSKNKINSPKNFDLKKIIRLHKLININLGLNIIKKSLI